jgi:HPt (histidine-containing phosphotransfer) domain-containing protein
MENDAELFLQVAGLFAENVAPLMDSISEAIRNGEPDALRSSAHGLKGSAGTIRATKVFRTAKQLEDMAKSYDLSQAPTAWKALQHEVQRLLDYLATLTPEGVENASHSG